MTLGDSNPAAVARAAFQSEAVPGGANVVLVDTSVWVDHLRSPDAVLASLLKAKGVACHPFIIGELACGNVGKRAEVFEQLAELPSLDKATDEEVLTIIETHRLMGHGLGLVDVHLLASCALAGLRLWTRDAALADAAARLGLAARV